MQIDLDVDTKKMGRFVATLRGVSDPGDPEASEVINSLIQAASSTVGIKINRVICEVAASGDDLIVNVRCFHHEFSSMRATATEAKSRLGAAGHAVAYSEADKWTPEEKALARARRVIGFNSKSVE